MYDVSRAHAIRTTKSICYMVVKNHAHMGCGESVYALPSAGVTDPALGRATPFKHGIRRTERCTGLRTAAQIGSNVDASPTAIVTEDSELLVGCISASQSTERTE